MSRAFHPAAAFRDPVWLGALLLLAVNDHLLKGAAMLPGVVTGKLSDFAGLLVAPAVLAWLLRVRTRRGWTAAHVAVGLGFVALQLAPALATGLAHLEMHVWPDPSDLLALPMLAWSHRRLGPGRECPVALPRLALGAVGLLVCTATSRPPPPRYPYRPGGTITADVVYRHTDAESSTVELSRIADDVRVDCDRLLAEPRATAGELAFDVQASWLAERGDALPLWDRLHDARDRDCYAARLTVRRRGGGWLIVWRHGEPPNEAVELTRESEDEDPHAVRFGPDGQLEAPPGVRVARW